jgi:hypothetical protein
LLAALLMSTAAPTQAADLGNGPAGGSPAVHETDFHGSRDATHPFFLHRLMIQAGAAFNRIDSSAQVGTAQGTSGTVISFEDDLGLASDKTAFDGLIRYRISDRWIIEGEYYGLPRSRSVGIEGEIKFGPLTFPVSASVNGEFNIALGRLAAGYTFLRSHNAEVGAAVSLYVSRFDTMLAGEASIGDASTSFQSERFEVAAPLPTIGLYASYAPTSRWLISGRADFIDLHLSSFKWFGYDLDDVEGRIVSLEASAEYRLLENLGVGIGYRYMDVSMGAVTDGLRGGINYKVSAPTAFARVSF